MKNVVSLVVQELLMLDEYNSRSRDCCGTTISTGRRSGSALRSWGEEAHRGTHNHPHQRHHV